MRMAERLRGLLEQSGAPYTQTVHPLAYTAREVAVAEHLAPHRMAKTVVFLADSGYGMAVIPANRLVDFEELRITLRQSHARLATEDELAQLFPDCELGAMPPFGSLYGMPVYLDDSLLGDEMIVFNAGTHRDVVHMPLAEYRRLTNPEIVSLAREAVSRRRLAAGGGGENRG